jgi:lipoprotein NlpI
MKFIAGDFKGAASVFFKRNQMNKDWITEVMRYLALARSGEKIDAELKANIAALKSDKVFAVVELYLGKMTPEDVLKVADTLNNACLAKFHSGEWHYLNGRTAEASALLKSVLAECEKISFEYRMAKAELKRWQK